MFLRKLDSEPDFEKKASAKLTGYIRDRIRDTVFARKILGTHTITPQECQVSVRHEGLVYIHEMEPDSSAMSMAWTGEPWTQYVRPKKYEIPFFQIGTKEFAIHENELMATRLALTKIVEKNAINDMGTVEDHRFLTMCEACAVQTGKVVKGVNCLSGTASGDIEVDDIQHIKNSLAEDRRAGTTLLVNDVDLNGLMKWNALEMGDKWKGEQVWGNAQADKIFGLKVIRTAKTNLLKSGNIWLFCDPEWVGLFLLLAGFPKAEVRKERSKITWSSWEMLGMSIANGRAMAKLELYAGTTQSLPTEEELFKPDIAIPPKDGDVTIDQVPPPTPTINIY